MMYIFRVYLNENVHQFFGLAFKLVLENMLSIASTMFYLVLNETL